ncbi:ABC transporter ATP-binding protein [Paenibacillus sp. J31TS4]|uniref:AAA family ATPase n=1 Tax=Paenibacillus sp. J31TS4 TaxID=2807195 RepID=UPI001B0764B9|nr:AAA family ATPase [Paenibacillus sp. J31TS4]GIP38083.1 ABC transporter ATP-binding protein [Paenibacillus sp. J31TS4]
MFLRSVSLLPSAGEEDPSGYPFSIPSIRRLPELRFTTPVTFLVGENGSGKSTLLEGIADQCDFNTAGGGRNNRFEVHASGSSLGRHLRLSWMPRTGRGFFLRAETFYQFASHLDVLAEEDGAAIAYGAYGGRSLHEQSHGESFLSLFVNRFTEPGLYLLDEPEAALSPARQLAFLSMLHDRSRDSQFVIATHSPILLGFPGARILSFDEPPVRELTYEETPAYTITRRFLERPDSFFRHLFED